jgi:23S rRNA pseudouridine1911/1915/1917 synthase
MVIAKNNQTHTKLTEQLQNRILKRNYLGITWGVLNPKSGQIEGYMNRSKANRNKMEMVNDDSALYSLTNYKTIKTFLGDSLSLVEFKLDTGRTHQIRVHCSFKGCPIVGDQVYGGNARHLKKEYRDFSDIVDNFPRQALHSYKIELLQPNTKKKLGFEVDMPEDMKRLIVDK